MMKSLIFILIFIGSIPVKAAFTKGEICGGLFLRVLNYKSYDLSGMDQETRKTYQAFQKFRKTQLPHPDNSRWNFEDISTHSETASKKDLENVAGRIRGLEVTHEGNIFGADGFTKYSASGFRISGLKRISNFFLMMKLDAGEFKKLRDKNIKLATGLGVEFLLVKLFHPIINYRVKRAEAYNKKFEEFMFLALSAAKSQVPTAWVYSSDSTLLYSFLPTVYSPQMLKEIKGTAADIMGVQSHLEIPTSKFEKELAQFIPQSDLLVDYLLHYEKDGDEKPLPVLDVFLRVAAPHDPPPPSGGKRKEDTEFNLDAVLQPVPIRTN